MPARRDRDGHGLTALRVTGALLPPDFLQTIACLKATKQSGADYGLSKSLVLKDEIARYWRIANDLYAAYTERRRRTDLDEHIIGVNEWLVPLLRDVFGYSDLSACPGIMVGEQSFPITHLALNKSLPLLLTVGEHPLDRGNAQFGEDGRRRAPYGVVQELLNSDDSMLWGVVSNGGGLRLLRDNPSLTRPAYIEADLERIFEEQLYADFSALWLTLHASRLRPFDGKIAGCILESWRAQAHDKGERALEHLRDGVTTALRELGNGFLHHKANDSLRTALASGSLTADSYFQGLLRLVYRLLFLFAAEDRDLLHLRTATHDQRAVYRDGYSLSRLRDRALHRRHYERHSDLWDGLQILFSALRSGAASLGLPALGGLFSEDQCTSLDAATISNQNLLNAIRALVFFRSGGILARVNYRDMGTEELGSVYESLLELHPFIDVNNAPWTFGFVDAESGEGKGSARKLTGSYYTPTALVNELIKSALEPVISQVMAKHPDDPRHALLDIKVLDPACGSGHFLLAAARHIAAEIARIEARSDTPDEGVRQHALREVVQHCIYGVDRNPLAVELCRTALWIETVEPGRPLTFLDPHIQCGDSLIGIVDPRIMDDGIPDEAYKPLVGDDPVVCRQLKKRNAQLGATIQGELFDQDSIRTAAEVNASLDAMPEETLEQVSAKRDAWETAHRAAGRLRDELRANLFVGAFFAGKTSTNAQLVPLTEDLDRVKRGVVMRANVEEYITGLATTFRFFHWHIAFPDIMRNGGFDVVLGNPPWERIKLQEQEFFAHRSPEIANAANKAAREVLIKKLLSANATPAQLELYSLFLVAKRASEAASQFLRLSGRYPLTGAGDVNTYAVFAETFLELLSPEGRSGMVVPSGIATEESNKYYFSEVMSKGLLESMFSFYEVRSVFRDTDSRQPFCLLTLRGGSSTTIAARFCFGIKDISEINRDGKVLTLTANDLELLSPNTGTCPVFRSAADVEVTREIYARSGVLINDRRKENNWGITFLRMFDMATDSELFRTAESFHENGAQQSSNQFNENEQQWLPLYESKMFYQYDHRFGSFESSLSRTSELPRPNIRCYIDPEYVPMPWYWVAEDKVASSLRGWDRRWLIAFRSITSGTLEHTAIFSILPSVGVGHSACVLMPGGVEPFALTSACLLGMFNSLIFDYSTRQKVSGLNFSLHFLKQLPALRPDAFGHTERLYIVPRIAELCVTAYDVHSFLQDIWVEADEQLRSAILTQWSENREFVGVGRGNDCKRQSDGCPREPFVWNEDRRMTLRAQLDAYYAKLFGLSREHLQFILEPAIVCGSGYPTETFRVLKQREMKEYGEYRTARLVMQAWDALEPRLVSPPPNAATPA